MALCPARLDRRRRGIRAAVVGLLWVLLAGAGGVAAPPASAEGGDVTGSLDVVDLGPGGALVQGWSRDPDSTGPTQVHVYVDGVGAAIGTAGNLRGDLPFPDQAHGFSFLVPTTPGPMHTVCAYGINIAGSPGSNALLGCKPTQRSSDPFGSFDGVQSLPDGMTARVYGWAIDSDSGANLGIHLYVDGVRHTGITGTCTDCAVLTGRVRPDVQRAFPAWLLASDPSFALDVALPRPDAQICAYAMDAPGTPGINVFLGCRAAGGSHDPTGAASFRVQPSAFPQHNTEDVFGWAYDPDSPSSVQVAVYWFGVVQFATGERRVDWSQPLRAVVLPADQPQVSWSLPPDPTGPSPAIGARYFGPALSSFLAGSLPYGGFCAWALNVQGTPGTNTLLSCSAY